MGIHGLWDLIAPSARRCNLESLSERVIAVDASIWIIQFVKAMRDESGTMPIFVFDGPPPPLKLKTIARRHELYEKQKVALNRTAEKLLLDQLKLKVLNYSRSQKKRSKKSHQCNAENESANRIGDQASNRKEHDIKDPKPSMDSFYDSTELFEEKPVMSSTHLNTSTFLEDLHDVERRSSSLNSIPPELNTFLMGRRRLDDLNLNNLNIESILTLPKRFKDHAFHLGEWGTKGLSSETMEDVKEFHVAARPGDEDFLSVPLDRCFNIDVFHHLPSKLQYSILNEIRDLWLNETRFLSIKAKDDAETFSHIQIETFLRNVSTTREINIVKKKIADELHSSLTSGNETSNASYISQDDRNLEDNKRISVKSESIEHIPRQEQPHINPPHSALELGPNGHVVPLVIESGKMKQDNSRTKRARRGATAYSKILQRQLGETETVSMASLNSVSKFINNSKRGSSKRDLLNLQPTVLWEQMKTANELHIMCSPSAKLDGHYGGPQDAHPAHRGHVETDAHDLTCTDNKDVLYTDLAIEDIFLNCSETPRPVIRDSVQREEAYDKRSSEASPVRKDVRQPTVPHIEFNDSTRYISVTPYRSHTPTFSKKRITLVKKVNDFASDRDSKIASSSNPNDCSTIKNANQDDWGSWDNVEDHQSVSIYLSNTSSLTDTCSNTSLSPLAAQDDGDLPSGVKDQINYSVNDVPKVTNEDVILMKPSDVLNTVENIVKQTQSRSSEVPINVDQLALNKDVPCSGNDLEKDISYFTARDTTKDSPNMTVSRVNSYAATEENRIDHTVSSLHKDLELQIEKIKSKERALNEDLKAYKRGTDHATPDMIEDIKELLSLFGIPYVVAPAEAEAQCATLTEMGLCDSVISEDSDCFAFGARVVYRNFFATNGAIEVYDMALIEKELNLYKKDIILLAILLGCDYTLGVSGVGIVNAAETIHAFHDFNGLVEFRDWAKNITFLRDNGVLPTDTAEKKLYKETHKNYRFQWVFPDLFPNIEVWNAFYSPIVDHSKESFSWEDIHSDEILRLLEANTSLTRKTILETLQPVLNRRSKTTPTLRQTKINEFFTPLQHNERVASIRSKRLQKLFPCLSSEANVNKTPHESSKKKMTLCRTVLQQLKGSIHRVL